MTVKTVTLKLATYVLRLSSVTQLALLALLTPVPRFVQTVLRPNSHMPLLFQLLVLQDFALSLQLTKPNTYTPSTKTQFSVHPT